MHRHRRLPVWAGQRFPCWEYLITATAAALTTTADRFNLRFERHEYSLSNPPLSIILPSASFILSRSRSHSTAESSPRPFLRWSSNFNCSSRYVAIANSWVLLSLVLRRPKPHETSLRGHRRRPSPPLPPPPSTYSRPTLCSHFDSRHGASTSAPANFLLH